MHNDGNSEIMTEADVAELMQVTVRTVQGWRYNKIGPPYTKIGGTIRYRRSQILEWMSDQRTEPSNRHKDDASKSA